MNTPEHPQDLEKTQTWVQLARERREQEDHPALIESDPSLTEQLQAVSSETDQLLESGDGIEWINQKSPEDTDDNLTPYSD